MSDFFKPQKVPRFKVRVSSTGVVYYVGGDASSAGFGSTIERKKGTGISRELNFEHGEWKGVYREEYSSNWREFANLVESF